MQIIKYNINKNQDIDQDNEDSNDSQSFDYGAYRERLDNYVQQERERELEDNHYDSSAAASYDSGSFKYPDSLQHRTAVCIGNDINGGPGGVLDGLYTSQLSYINGKRWYKLTDPQHPLF